MVAERREYGNLRLRPDFRFRPIRLVVLGITAVINEIAADNNHRRLLTRYPPDQRSARYRIRHTLPLSEARITVDDERQWCIWICDGDLKSRRGSGECPDGKHLQR